MSDDLGESAAAEKKNTSKGQAAPAPAKGLFSNVQPGRALVLVPEDLIARREATQALEEALTAPGSRQPRVFTSINLRKLDGTFSIFTALAAKKAGREIGLKLSAEVPCGKHTTESTQEALGDDIDFGIESEPVKVLDLPSIVNAIQKGVGPNWRVAFNKDGAIRLLNT